MGVLCHYRLTSNELESIAAAASEKLGESGKHVMEVIIAESKDSIAIYSDLLTQLHTALGGTRQEAGSFFSGIIGQLSIP